MCSPHWLFLLVRSGYDFDVQVMDSLIGAAVPALKHNTLNKATKEIRRPVVPSKRIESPETCLWSINCVQQACLYVVSRLAMC
ncbi:hypothetical protein T06_3929 [Trichinella sp. T6]|nr:hypothetical protein T06_3929 [Trichinella sp. T6]KRZ95642.1 hypothetical protein T08_12707 [Trichinella sp. T8]